MVTEENIKKYYNQRHTEMGENAWRPYEAYSSFFDYLKVEKGKKLLDVGCGTGFLLKTAKEKGLDTYGVDISEEGIKIAQKNAPESKINVGKGEQLEFENNSFDYVTCIGALEHFLDIQKGISEFQRVAKPDSSFCIVVPNIDYIYWKIKGKKGTEQIDINEKLLSLEQWKNMFENSGFEILSIHQDTWPFKKAKVFATKNPVSVLLRVMCKFFYFLIPLKYTYQFIFIMKLKQKHTGLPKDR